MPISFDEKEKIFYLNTKNTSYVLGFVKHHLVHCYWGKKIDSLPSVEAAVAYGARAFSQYNYPDDNTVSNDSLPMEYPTYGNVDARTPAFHAIYDDGSSITDFRYKSHTVTAGKPVLEGLPATYAAADEAQTLEIVMEDEKTGLELHLLYTAFEEIDVITRSVRVENKGKTTANIESILSASVDFYRNDFEMISLYGSWGRERHIQRVPLLQGAVTVDSKRGASSHQMSPFIALVNKNTTENMGDAYGMNFVYSGNFTAGAETDQFGMTRMFMGLNPFDFRWNLAEGESFTAPEVVMVYSDAGIGQMSRTFHDLYRNNLCRGKYAKKERPVLINNWEATYFDFDEDKIVKIAKKAKEIGVELMVLDDGWFGVRNDDKSSLGDWFVNKEKLPDGISGLSERIEALGMKFGLWFEPEMISPVSKLYEAHPDWCLHVKERSRSHGRHQLILDYSNKEVCDYIINTMGELFRSSKISYIKWDMNRHMTEIGSAYLPAERQRETAHRYILGLYYVLETLTSEFKDILFESCSGGGGRFDPGMLYYMPQTWTSDNSDAVERLFIQHGTSIAYPPNTMGAHVSAVPNHQVERTTSMKLRANVALIGQFGFELDLNKLSDEELAEAKEAVVRYKKYGNTIHFGDMYRLLSPYEGNNVAWEFVSKDKSEAVICCYNILAKANGDYYFVKPEGLDEDAIYEDSEHNIKMSGLTLMNVGIPRINVRDFDSEIYVFEKV